MSLPPAVHSSSEKNPHGGCRDEREDAVGAHTFCSVCEEGQEGRPCRNAFRNVAFLPVVCLLARLLGLRGVIYGFLASASMCGRFPFSFHLGVVAPSFLTTAVPSLSQPFVKQPLSKTRGSFPGLFHEEQARRRQLTRCFSSRLDSSGSYFS